MSNKVTVVDYGLGNIFSISMALKHCNAEVDITSNPKQIANAERLVLPGVGSFEVGMKGLSDAGLINSIHEFIAKDRPFLGICLGMQMMLDESHEFGKHKGLGLIAGTVEPIPLLGTNGKKHKVPHIGWNEIVTPDNCNEWGGTMLDGTPEDTSFYFVHSFAAMPENDEERLADTYYDGVQISAVIKSGHHYGMQFHPEKSGKAGHYILLNFINRG